MFPSCSPHLAVSLSASLPVLFHRLVENSVSPLEELPGQEMCLDAAINMHFSLKLSLHLRLKTEVLDRIKSPNTQPKSLGLAEAKTSWIWDFFFPPAHCYPSR